MNDVISGILMKNFFLKISLSVFIGLFLSQFGYAQNIDANAQRLYKDAKMFTISQNWTSAADLYKKVITEFPNSPYNDESQFWLGYCLEKEDNKAEEAFTAFQTLVDRSPASPWVDDAIIRQIRLAEQFVNNGNQKYKTFLNNHLSDDQTKVRHEAALALARLGDTSSIPVLKEMRDREEYKGIIDPFISELESSSQKNSDQLTKDIHIDENLKSNVKTSIADNAGSHLHYYSEKRFEQYQNMTRQSNDWWDEELLAFGLWHIVSADEFDAYISLPPQKRKEWYNIYWKKNDPTPTTLINEARIEFERRVHYARDNFSYYDGLEGFFYAPWDARGEVYIKYGKPAVRKKDAYREFWSYPRNNNLHFLIKPNVTNIFGRAIFLDNRSGSRNRVDAERMRNEYIFAPRFDFIHDENIKVIKDLEIKVERVPKNRAVLLLYQMPINQFAVNRRDDIYHVEYVQSYILYDSQMNEIKRQERIESVEDASKRRLIAQKEIEQAIRFDLEPGKYTIALQIKDKWSNKIAVRSIDFNVKS